MRFLKYLEKAWIAAAIAALVTAIVNLVRLQVFDNRTYFPLFCAGFCMLIWFNVRGQRRFREKVLGDGQDQPFTDPKN